MTVVAAIVLGSCSKNSAVLDVVPADVDVVLTADIDDAVNTYGISFADSGIVFPEEFPAGLIQPSYSKVIANVANTLDLTNVVMFARLNGETTGNPGFYAVAGVTEPDALVEILKTKLGATTQADNGLTRFSIDGINVYIKDGLAWLTNGDAAAVNAVADAAKSDCFFSSAVAKAVAPEGSSTLYINTGFISNVMPLIQSQLPIDQRMAVSAAVDYLTGKWLIMSTDHSGETFTSKMTACDADGNILEVPYLKDLDASFLKYVPESYTAVLAGALNDDALTMLQTLYSTYASAAVPRAMASQLESVVKAFEGNFFVATDLNAALAGAKEPKMMPVTMGVKFKSDDEARNALNTIADIARMTFDAANVSVTPEMVTIKADNYNTFNIYAKDSYLLTTNESELGSGNSQLKQYVSGHELALGVEIASLTTISPEYDFGLQLGICVDPKSVSSSVRYTGKSLAYIAGKMLGAAYGTQQPFEPEPDNWEDDYAEEVPDSLLITDHNSQVLAY